MTTALFTFLDAIRAAGLVPPESVEPGKFYRFPGAGKGPSNSAGWCFLFPDCRGGVFGDWSTDLHVTWQLPTNPFLSKEERAELARKTRAAKAEAKEQRRMTHSDAAARAMEIWSSAAPAPDSHPYLTRKGIPAYGARLHNNLLTLPVATMEGQLASLQFIAADGTKRLLSGGRKQGCFIPVTELAKAPSRIIICEGWTTGCSIAESTPSAVVLAAIDAGNLEPVAVAARCQWPETELVIAGDDDRLTPGNPGATKARAAALASDAQLALPPWPDDAPRRLTDFNDLANWLSRGAV